jgi:hypothetical protein
MSTVLEDDAGDPLNGWVPVPDVEPLESSSADAPALGACGSDWRCFRRDHQDQEQQMTAPYNCDGDVLSPLQRVLTPFPSSFPLSRFLRHLVADMALVSYAGCRSGVLLKFRPRAAYEFGRHDVSAAHDLHMGFLPTVSLRRIPGRLNLRPELRRSCVLRDDPLRQRGRINRPLLLMAITSLCSGSGDVLGVIHLGWASASACTEDQGRAVARRPASRRVLVDHVRRARDHILGHGKTVLYSESR